MPQLVGSGIETARTLEGEAVAAVCAAAKSLDSVEIQGRQMVEAVSALDATITTKLDTMIVLLTELIAVSTSGLAAAGTLQDEARLLKEEFERGRPSTP